MFLCNYCQRSYQRKIYFDRHVIACQFLSKTKKERSIESEELSDTPSVRELYSIILELSAKCNTLESKLNEISKWTSITKKKLNIIDWLNTTYSAGIEYSDWVNSIKITKSDLNVLFESDFVNGVVSILQRYLILDNVETPIRAFKNKENAFYIRQSHIWVMCDSDTFTQLMYLFDKQFMNEFIIWQTENKSRMSSDDSFSTLYARNMKKIMGGNYTREQLYSRIKKELYMYICCEPPTILEYETTF
jgi:hypothetical protein